MAFSAMSGIFLIVAVFMSAGNAFANICDGGNDHMCVDWSFGSQRMALAQLNYKQRTGEDVLFGMGSYGGPDDENMGKCYKFTTDTADVPFIAQVTNQGVDIEANQFDMVSLSHLCILSPKRNLALFELSVRNPILTTATFVFDALAFTANGSWRIRNFQWMCRPDRQKSGRRPLWGRESDTRKCDPDVPGRAGWLWGTLRWSYH